MTRPFLLFLLLSSSAWLADPAIAANPIQLENAKSGDPHWTLNNIAHGEIEGYASATSANRGESIRIFVNTVDPSYQIEIYRLGWYGGSGARKILGPILRTGLRQPIPPPDPATGLIECDWSDPYVLTIPADADPTEWCSGVYLAKLTGSSGKQQYVMFVVRDDARPSNHYFQSSVTTMQAYNDWGGASLYTGSPRAVRVSFNRPYSDLNAGTGDFLWHWEYNMVRFLEREGYDVTYSTNIDTARRGELLLNHRSFLSVGHDEYWSAAMRANVEAARDHGVSLGFFSANDCYWQIRLEPDSGGNADRTIVAYKESALARDPYALDSDPSNDVYVTTNWRSAPVNRPEASLIGVQYIYNPVKPPGDIVIDDTAGAPWVFDETSLQPGSKLVGLLGYEVDAIDGSSPPNVVRAGHSPFQDTSTSPSTTRYSDMTVYTAPSGAVVFASGSIQWSWGLDDWNEEAHEVPVSPAAQQITRNLLRRFAGGNAPADCQFTVDPARFTAGNNAGNATVTITTATTCSWTAVSDTGWLAVTSPQEQVTGSGTAAFSWTANVGPARVGTITIGDRLVEVRQDDGCTFSLSPASAALPASGGTGSFTVTASSADCAWSALPRDGWVSVTAGSSGRGGGTVAFSASSNSGSSRTTTIDVAGQAFALSQASGCEYAVSPASISAPKEGGTGEIRVTTDGTCHWTAGTSNPWITITAGEDGRGEGTITYSMATNDGAARSGSISAAGINVPVQQEGVPCSYSISPADVSAGPAASSIDVTLTATPRCAWKASSSTPWMSIAPVTGSGSATVTVSFQENASPSVRQGTATIAGRRFTLTQSGAPASLRLSATGTSSTSASLTWTVMAGAAAYQVMRRTGVSGFGAVGTVPQNSFVDGNLTHDAVYFYQVRAVDSAGATIAVSNVDPAIIVAFTDDPVRAANSVIKAVHLKELRTAIDELREAAGLPPFAYSSEVASGTVVKAADFLEMRASVDEAYAALGLPRTPWDPSLSAGAAIRAADLQAIREAAH